MSPRLEIPSRSHTLRVLTGRIRPCLNFPIPNRPTLVSEQSANPKLDSSAQSEGQISQTRGPRKSSAWKYLVSLACVGAGVLVAVQLINPADQSVEEFAELEVSAGLDTISIDGDAADEDVESKGIDDLDGRLANMVSDELIEAASHPLEPVLKLADEGLRRMDRKIVDYTATIISQVTINDTLQPEKRIFCKIRHPKTVEAGSALPGQEIPFSVYLKMLAPSSIAGQEAIWVKGQNNDKLIGHTTGMLNVKRAYLNPAGPISMRGNLHPIYEIGFLNLVRKMGVVGRRDLQYPDCSVTVTRDVSVGDQTCTLIEIKHTKADPKFEFHVAKIYIDQRRDVLVGYEGFLWPEKEGDPPKLKEKYFYTDVKLNVGLTDEDFSPDNKDYDYPGW